VPRSMLSLILRTNFFWDWPCRKNVFGSFLRPFDNGKDFLEILLFRYFKNYYKYLVTYAYALAFMRTPSIRIRNWCVYEHTSQELVRALSNEHTHQILMHALRKGSLKMLSIRIRNWCVDWAYSLGTDACTVHTHKDLCVCSAWA
jgi:hypothetical protein